jgi:hypothetical protein
VEEGGPRAAGRGGMPREKDKGPVPFGTGPMRSDGVALG